jgi:histone H3/H4
MDLTSAANRKRQATRRRNAAKKRKQELAASKVYRPKRTQRQHEGRHYATGLSQSRTRAADIFVPTSMRGGLNWIKSHRKKHAASTGALMLPLSRVHMMMQEALRDKNRQISESAVRAVAIAGQDVLNQVLVSAATIADLGGGRVTVKPRDVAAAYLAMLEGARGF